MLPEIGVRLARIGVAQEAADACRLIATGAMNDNWRFCTQFRKHDLTQDS
jgi:hypothetical protein